MARNGRGPMSDVSLLSGGIAEVSFWGRQVWLRFSCCARSCCCFLTNSLCWLLPFPPETRSSSSELSSCDWLASSRSTLLLLDIPHAPLDLSLKDIVPPFLRAGTPIYIDGRTTHHASSNRWFRSFLPVADRRRRSGRC